MNPNDALLLTGIGIAAVALRLLRVGPRLRREEFEQELMSVIRDCGPLDSLRLRQELEHRLDRSVSASDVMLYCEYLVDEGSVRTWETPGGRARGGRARRWYQVAEKQ